MESIQQMQGRQASQMQVCYACPIPTTIAYVSGPGLALNAQNKQLSSALFLQTGPLTKETAAIIDTSAIQVP